jgi:hypothetical protein
LHDQSRSRLAVVARDGNQDKITAFHRVQPSSSWFTSIHVITSFSACLFLAAAWLCRRHSSANPRARVTGTQNWTRRKPARRLRSRQGWTLSRRAVFFARTCNRP